MIDMLNINNDSAKSLRMESKSTQSLTILSTFECKTSGFPGVLLKGLHYTTFWDGMLWTLSKHLR